MRIRILVLATAGLLFGAIMTVPRIIEPQSRQPPPQTQPVQFRDADLK